MDTIGNAILGVVFLVLAFASTFLMYKLWGYPYDHEKMKSEAPPFLMFVHRAIGYVYFAIYVYLMFQMVPRLWTYQVELPARTVAHLTLGMAIGVILIAKVAIVRFFKHLESQMVPILGTGLLICTTLLIGLSVPFALKEVALSKSRAGGTVFSQENLERVRMLVPKAGFPEEAPLEKITTEEALQQGRNVLLNKCVVCHDLRTVLIRPKTPNTWVNTVERMAERSLLTDPIDRQEQWLVSAYLIAISPELQKSVKMVREREQQRRETKAEAQTVSQAIRQDEVKVETIAEESQLSDAELLFEEICSQCHRLSNVEESPPADEDEAADLIDRMIDNGLDVDDEEFELLVYYLTKTFGKN